MEDFKSELTTLINKHSLENDSNTPDHILARYIQGCLAAFNTAVNTRNIWHGLKPRSSKTEQMHEKVELNSWYEEKIEQGVRNVVKLLRRNGINTECSCEHEKYVQCQYPMDEDIKRVDSLLFNNGFRNYKIVICIIREDGHLRKTMNIEFRDLTEQTYEVAE